MLKYAGVLFDSITARKKLLCWKKMIYFDARKLALKFLNIFGDFRDFQNFIIFGVLRRCVCVSHSEQKLPQRLFFTKADLNDPLLLRNDGLEPNEFIDLSHEPRFHPKSAETSFNEMFAN